MKNNMVGIINPALTKNLRDQLGQYQPPSAYLAPGVYNMDVCDFLNQIQPNSVNLMIVDEDYSAETSAWNPAAKDENVSKFEWEVHDVPTHLARPWVYQAKELLVEDHGNLIIFGFPLWATTATAIVHDAGLNWRTHRVWIKLNSAPNRRPNAPNFPSHYECVWVASKGRYHMNVQEPRVMSNWVYETVCEHCHAIYPVYRSSEWDHPSWFAEVQQWEISDEELPPFDGPHFMESICPNCGRQSRMWRQDQVNQDYLLKQFYASPLTNDRGRAHKTKKPLWLYQELMNILSDPGDVIVDPMCGQGTAAMAAVSMARPTFYVNDLDPKWAEFVRRSLAIHS